MEEILAHLLAIHKTLEIHGRMLADLVESDSRRTHDASVARAAAQGQMASLYQLIESNPIFRDNPDFAKMLGQMKGA